MVGWMVDWMVGWLGGWLAEATSEGGIHSLSCWGSSSNKCVSDGRGRLGLAWLGLAWGRQGRAGQGCDGTGRDGTVWLGMAVLWVSNGCAVAVLW